MQAGQKRVVIYGADWCPYCQNAKKLFGNLNVPFDYINTDENPEIKQQLYAKYSWRTIPMIFIDNQFKGGLSDVQAKLRSGEIIFEDQD